MTLGLARNACLLAGIALLGFAEPASSQTTYDGYQRKVMARTGSVGSLTTIDPELSINDAGIIAFSGADAQGSKAFVLKNGSVAGITFVSSNRLFSTAAINNFPLFPYVASRDRVSGAPPTYYIRKWPADGSQNYVLVGKSPDNFDSALLYVDINKLSVVAFSGLINGSSQIALFAGTTQPPTMLASFASSTALRPQISDTNRIIVRGPAPSIVAYDYPSGAATTFAGVSTGFTSLGREPGISADGRAVTFSGNRANGDGVFLVLVDGTTTNLVRVAGEGQDAFTGVSIDERVGVISTGDLATQQYLTVVFSGSKVGEIGVYSVNLTAKYLAGGTLSVVAAPHRTVVRLGQTIDGQTVASRSLYDPINRHGTIAMWVSFSSGTQGILRAQSDRDGDGLLDVWETAGIDYNQDGTVDLDLPALGANPDHKDVFVEVDALLGQAPTQAALNSVISSFAVAPAALVHNPDGLAGVALHCDPLTETDILPNVPFSNGFGDLDPVKAAHFGSVADRASANWPNIEQARKLVYHYCLFAHSIVNDDAGGQGELVGNDFMTLLGTTNWANFPDQDEIKAAAFMHELGHNLGLHHGGRDAVTGADSINNKPNYRSLMNYLWAYPGGANTANWSLDYSRGDPYVDLDEASLDEGVGVGGLPGRVTLAGPPPERVVMEAFPVDWNGNNDFTETNVAADVDWIDPAAAPSPGENLVAREDWSVLVYDFRDSSDYADGMHLTTQTQEYTSDQYQQQLDQCAGPGHYCTAKVNSLGCAPVLTFSGTPSLGGADDFVVRVDNLLNNQPGVLLWSRSSASIPFGGGTFCLGGSPKRVVPGIQPGGAPPPATNCTGSYVAHLTHALMTQKGWAAGDTIFVQLWSSDSGFAPPNNVGLSSGLVFAVCP